MEHHHHHELLLPIATNPSENEPNRTTPRREFTYPFADIASSWRSSASTDIASTTDAAMISVISSTPHSTSLTDIIANYNKKRRFMRRSHSAPSVFTNTKEAIHDSFNPKHPPTRSSFPLIVWQAFVCFIIYVIVGIVIYLVECDNFKGEATFRPVDALYFSVVTLCTIGYGDIVPDSTFTKLYTCVFILVGFGFVDILLNGLLTYTLDRQEAVLLSAVDEKKFNTMFHTYIIDTEKGRMRIRIKVALALAVVIGCIAVGTVCAHVLEGMSWVDSIYLSVTSVTTVGYGDYSFSTTKGRCFAIVWLLVSTLAVARAFLYLTELRIDKRNREMAKWVLQKKMTLGDILAADLDNDGSISKSEYVIYKLKEMGKISKKEILQICNQFDSLDNSNCGKLTMANLMGSGDPD